MIVTVLLLMLCLALRIYPRVILGDFLVSDTYFHLGTADDIRKAGMKVPDTLKYYALPNKHRYPFFFHWLWALLPRKSWLIAERFTSAICDTLLAAIYWYCATYLAPENSMAPNWVLAIYAVTPGLIRTGDGPRVFNLSPRIFVLIFYVIHLLIFFKATEAGSVFHYMLSALLCSFLFFTATFPVQSLLFIGVGISIFYNWNYLLVISAGFLISIPISFGRSPGIFMAAFKHAVFYAQVQRRVLYSRHRNFFFYLKTMVGYIKRLLINRELREFMVWYISESNYLHLLVTMFTPVLLILSLFALPEFDIYANPALKFYGIVFLSGFAVFLITKHKPFLFLGSGERYLEYVYGFGLTLGCLFAEQYFGNVILWIVCAYCLLVCLFILKNYISVSRSAPPQMQELEQLFKANVFDSGMVMLPLNANHSKLIHYFAPQVRILVYQTQRDRKRLSDEELYRIWPVNFNYSTADLNYLIDTYFITHIFCNKRELKHYIDKIFIDSDKFYKLFSIQAESENYCLLRRN